MRKHPTRRLVLIAGILGFILAACGAASGAGDDPVGPASGACLEGATDCDDIGSQQGVADGEQVGGSMNMCLPEVPDCVDTVLEGDPAADCEGAAGGCDDTADERMNPSITIVPAFVDPNTPSVEMAPGSVAEPFTLFLQEAVVDGQTVQVSFTGGEAPCFVVDHVEVTEDADMVVVSVWAGQPDPDADCSSMSTSTQSVTVQLGAPLGNRLLLDGSRMGDVGDNV